MANRSRWGWHPCDYETFLLLKKLHALYEKAQRRYAAWRRWARKLPHNRVLRQRIVDERGRKVGSRVVGPRPEPALPALFCTREKVVRHWSEEGKHLAEGRTVELVRFCDLGIPGAYQAARRPVLTEEMVPPLSLTPDAIRRLAEQFGGME